MSDCRFDSCGDHHIAMTEQANPAESLPATNGAIKRGPCSRCGYVWYGRPRYPRGCARCHSAYWDTPAERRHGRIAGDPPNPNWNAGHKPLATPNEEKLVAARMPPPVAPPAPIPAPVAAPRVAAPSRQDRMGDEPFAFGPPPEYVPPVAPESTWLEKQEEVVVHPDMTNTTLPSPDEPSEPPLPTTSQLLALDPPRRIPAHGPVAISVEEFDIEIEESGR
jgi:hypothetical protein